MKNVACGSPTKKFFIEMLTRDIALNDAILDLLDNCLDGVINIKGADSKKTDKEYYKGYEAKITIAQNSFQIIDNCGGILRKTAEEYAFRMGRTNSLNNLPTVGIYGIGMKRAIFKIGKKAIIDSNHRDEAFSVEIPEDWAKQDNWNFPIKNSIENTMDSNGTRITVTKLTDSVAAQWKNDNLISYFVNELIAAIQASYSLIIEKGFSIFVNERNIESLPGQLLISKQKGKTRIEPYIFKKKIGDVSINLAIGFYAPPPTDEEIDENAENKRSSAEAGWTIICNDRVVLYNDKSYLTGWGEAGVPSYHTQFIGIRGIVVFESNMPEKLPMTTTKRGIDLSSPIYAEIKNKMRDGLKLFTNYTNKWKGRNEQERVYSAATESVPYSAIFDEKIIEEKGMKLQKTRDGGHLFQPALPKPSNDRNYEIIRFSKSKDEIDKVRRFFVPDASIDIKPSKVGEECFDRILKEINNGK
mgnify:CR=1 FL=1